MVFFPVVRMGFRSDLSSFHASRVVFTRHGPQPWPAEPLPEHPLLARLSLPHPQHEVEGMRLLLDHFLFAQDERIIAPLLALAFRCPMRRKLWPSEPGRGLVLVGSSELGEGSIGRLAMNLFGDFPHPGVRSNPRRNEAAPPPRRGVDQALRLQRRSLPAHQPSLP